MIRYWRNFTRLSGGVATMQTFAVTRRSIAQLPVMVRAVYTPYDPKFRILISGARALNWAFAESERFAVAGLNYLKSVPTAAGGNPLRRSAFFPVLLRYLAYERTAE
jgi:hypothetical protein